MRLVGVSAYAPEQAWSNTRVAARLRLERMRLRAGGDGRLSREQAKLFETGDRWVRRFIGFTGRRFCREGEGTIDLAARAARQLFERSGLASSDIDAIVVGSVTPSYLYSPPDAALLQHELGIPVWQGPAPREIVGADVSLACSSWVTSLMICYALIRAGLARRIVLIGADRMSAAINWRDRSFATVLGDAGTATLWRFGRPPGDRDGPRPPIRRSMPGSIGSRWMAPRFGRSSSPSSVDPRSTPRWRKPGGASRTSTWSRCTRPTSRSMGRSSRCGASAGSADGCSTPGAGSATPRAPRSHWPWR